MKVQLVRVLLVLRIANIRHRQEVVVLPVLIIIIVEILNAVVALFLLQEVVAVAGVHLEHLRQEAPVHQVVAMVAEEAVPVVVDAADRNNFVDESYIKDTQVVSLLIKIFRNKRDNEEGDLFMCISITFR